MVPSSRVDEAIQAVSRFLVADVALGDTLQHIAALAKRAIDNTDAVGVTLLDNRRKPVTAVCTDRISPVVDQAQYDDGCGPCLDAFAHGKPVRVDDTRAARHQWPSFSERAIAEGVLSTLSLPLCAGDETFGVFNLYSTRADAFVDHEAGDAALFVTQAAVVLANARAYWHMFDLASGLQTAMTSRADIEQAKGVIMSTTGRSSEEAFDLLRQQSQYENRKVREIAIEIVHRTQHS